MISFIKFTLMSMAGFAIVLAILAYEQHDIDQDALRTAVSARSL